MRFMLPALLTLHGVIHLLGFVKAFELAEVSELQLPVSPRVGMLWLATAILLLGSAAAAFLTPRLWWAPALVGVLLSQTLIIGAWEDARFGTIANVILLVPILLAAVDLRPSSLTSLYRTEARAAVATATRDATVLTAEDVAALPAPVRTYLERVGAVGAPRVRSFHAEFRAAIRGAPDDPWMRGTAEQVETFDPPARIFFMNVRRAGLPVHVLHRYVGTEARMEGRLLGLIPVVEVEGPKLTRSETVTLLNDVFFMAPAALVDLPIAWDTLDGRRVRATLTHAGHTVSAVAYFDERGDLSDFESDDRYQMDRDPPVLARWSTPLREPRDYGGVRLPSGGVALWGDAGEAWAYGDFDLLRIRYNVERP